MSRLIVTNVETQNIKFDSDTTAMTIDATGRTILPNKPAFRVRKTSAQTAGADNELVTWNSIDINIGSHFSSNIFTAPVAGVYFFTGAVLTPNDGTVQTYGFRHTPSGGSATNVFLLHSPNATTHETVSGSFIHQMGVNDTMGFHIRGSGNGIYGESDQWNMWSGYLIG